MKTSPQDIVALVALAPLKVHQLILRKREKIFFRRPFIFIFYFYLFFCQYIINTKNYLK